MEPKRLFRSRTDVMLGGVCGGLAKYLDVDPTIIRLVFILLFFIGGGGFWIYLVLWLITPVEPHSIPAAVIEVKSEKEEAIPTSMKKETNEQPQDSTLKLPDEEKVETKTPKNSTKSTKQITGTNRPPKARTENK